MLIIGHRGAAGLAPENTLEAMRAGREAGADMLEFDVRLTRDEQLVVIHDFHTLRTHHSASIVSQKTYTQLKQLSNNQLVKLEDVLDEFFGDVMLNIELKGGGTGAAVTKLLAKKYAKKSADWDNILLSSFKGRELWRARRVSRKANLALLHDQNPYLFIAYNRPLRLTAVGFHRLYVQPLALEIAKRSKLFTYAYTVNRPHAATLLAEQGVDGIVTDRPDLMVESFSKVR